MPVITPFRGVRFDPDKISFISRVVAPPYDIIDPPFELELRERDPYNVVRLTLGKTPQQGRPDEDYRQAGALFRQWCEEKALVPDAAPSIYVIEQTFALDDKEFTRCGFIAAVLLEELGKGSIFPHERTFGGPRTDRLKLTSVCHAILDQILGIYPDPRGEADAAVRQLCAGEPVWCFRDDDGVGYRMWQVTDTAAIGRLQELLRARTLVIADGHHRYESAFLHSQRHRSGTGPPGTAPEDYLPAFCISVADPGLKVLPTHRRARAPSGFIEEQTLRALKKEFDLHTVAVRGAELLQQDFDAARAGRPCIGIYLKNHRLVLLHPEDRAMLRRRFPASAEPWWDLPVSLLHHAVLPEALHILPGTPEEITHVDYRRDALQIFWGVESGQFDVGFLLPPLDPATVERVASQGERLPQKSTYFHPKIPAGLVMYAHSPGTLP